MTNDHAEQMNCTCLFCLPGVLGQRCGRLAQLVPGRLGCELLRVVFIDTLSFAMYSIELLNTPLSYTILRIKLIGISAQKPGDITGPDDGGIQAAAQ